MREPEIGSRNRFCEISKFHFEHVDGSAAVCGAEAQQWGQKGRPSLPQDQLKPAALRKRKQRDREEAAASSYKINDFFPVHRDRRKKSKVRAESADGETDEALMPSYAS